MHFEVPAGSGQGSTINADGTPYQVAWSTDGLRQAAKVIVDPFPGLSAWEQRDLVLNKLSSWLSSSSDEQDNFLDKVGLLGKSGAGGLNRFWVATDPVRPSVEVYTSLAADTEAGRENELAWIMEKLGYRVTLPPDGFNLGPLSYSSSHSCLSVYLRPRNLAALVSILPEALAGFLKVFSGCKVMSRGVLVCLKVGRERVLESKLDLCAHCVTPTTDSAKRIAQALGEKFRGTPINLPLGAGVAFWGVSLSDTGQRIYVYAVPAMDEAMSSRSQHAGIQTCFD